MFRKLGRPALIGLSALAVAGAVWWVMTIPPPYLDPAPAYRFGPVPASIESVTADGDPIAETVHTFADTVPGYDDIVLQEDLGRAYATGRDGWIWKVDLENGTAERFVDAPLMPAGAHKVPDTDTEICFCASYLQGATFPEDERVGLYRLNLETGEITTIFDRVPLPPPIAAPSPGNEGTVFAADTTPALPLGEMNDTNSRALAFCNDFDLSADGQRFYVSEPFPYEGASMGGGAYGEAITLGRNGRLWMYDAETGTVRLVAQNYNFIDGVLLETGADGRETSVLVTETTKFRMLRFYLTGERAGSDEIVWEYLPSMPDGLSRDAAGRVWVGMIKKRTPVVTWMHANPWIKPFMLRLPQNLLPVPTDTAVLALSPDASKPLWYAEHPGTHVQDIAAVTPGESGIYLANFGGETSGVHRIDDPLATH